MGDRSAESRRDHADWIGLAHDGPILALAEQPPAGTTVRIVAEPQAFEDLLDTERPRIAIAAIPPAGPADLERIIRERRARPRLRVVSVTPEKAVAERLDTLRLGFDEAVPATMDPAEIAGRLQLLEARARHRSDTVLPVADGCELDLVAHELRRDGRTVHLRPKEFGLLALLASHPGRAWTRRRLLDRVWGTDHEADPRTVDVHVSWLRSKIETAPERPVHLVTVRGVGYRLDPPAR